MRPSLPSFGCGLISVSKLQHAPIIVMAPDASSDNIASIVDLVASAGGEAYVTRGVSRTIIGLVGDVQRFATLDLRALPDIQTVPRGNHNLESALGFTQSLTHDGRRAVSTLPASPFSSRLATPERHFRFAFGCGPVLCRKTLRTPPRGDALSFGYSPPKWVGARGLAPPCPAGCQAY